MKTFVVVLVLMFALSGCAFLNSVGVGVVAAGAWYVGATETVTKSLTSVCEKYAAPYLGPCTSPYTPDWNHAEMVPGN